ncbi:hypothetical protein B0H13DRAFT_2293157 [Mycena leptocephala]|nr:hypothetical protein B0H13DRAFT_2293157 [Mycena leptocephala]
MKSRKIHHHAQKVSEDSVRGRFGGKIGFARADLHPAAKWFGRACNPPPFSDSLGSVGAELRVDERFDDRVSRVLLELDASGLVRDMSTSRDYNLIWRGKDRDAQREEREETRIGHLFPFHDRVLALLGCQPEDLMFHLGAPERVHPKAPEWRIRTVDSLHQLEHPHAILGAMSTASRAPSMVLCLAMRENGTFGNGTRS